MTDVNRTRTRTPRRLPPTATPHHPRAPGAALLRIAFGLTFLWACFDMLLALASHTGYDKAGNSTAPATRP